MIVVDVNTLVYLWIPGEMTERAEKALQRDPHWAAPVLWRSEFRNVLAGYIRRGDMSASDAVRCLDGAESQLAGHEYILPSSLVMQKVAASGCSAYDCEYVALAGDLNTVLVTSDKQILRAFPTLSVSLKVFSDTACD
ncbi:MAG: type II toxin-antitoxin system VapC family toxin [Verrucomicrobia bacterium]|jgi:predicted nucleic acid-binding protein|nr:type II toxin-antitoxin system VapC family toxin [Verrucomicrobiota bacterium]